MGLTRHILTFYQLSTVMVDEFAILSLSNGSDGLLMTGVTNDEGFFVGFDQIFTITFSEV